MKARYLFLTVLVAAVCGVYAIAQSECSSETMPTHYKEISYPSPNVDSTLRTEVSGVILHHTAEPTIERSLEVLTSPKRKVSTHVCIDTDGTRYIMAQPEQVAWHAGASVLNGREGCNKFCIGIEFQGNTLEAPLTDDQINSAIEYLLPIMWKYNIEIQNVVTHEMVRQAYKAKYPTRRVYDKVDITQAEYQRFMPRLQAAYDEYYLNKKRENIYQPIN